MAGYCSHGFAGPMWARSRSLTSRTRTIAARNVTAMIVVQAFVNMSVVLGLLPTKGITLPLVSNGGSSLLASLIGIGMLLNISQHEAADA